MSFSSGRTVRARKQYFCDECSRRISIGERYVYTAAEWEGNFFTNRACPQCDALRRYVGLIDGDYYETYYGGLPEWIANGGWQYSGCGVDLLRAVASFSMQWRARGGTELPVPVFEASS